MEGGLLFPTAMDFQLSKDHVNSRQSKIRLDIQEYHIIILSNHNDIKPKTSCTIALSIGNFRILQYFDLWVLLNET